MAAMINIIGPNAGKYIVAFRTEDGRSMGLLVSAEHADVLSAIQEKIPYGTRGPGRGGRAHHGGKLRRGEGTVPLRGLATAYCGAPAADSVAATPSPHP